MGALAAGVGLHTLGSVRGDGHDTEDEHERDTEGPLTEDDWVPPEASELHAAVLSGFQASANTDASGCVHVTPWDEDTLMVDLVLQDINCVTQAHIHEGERNEDGPVVAPLLEYTTGIDGTGEGDPLSTDPDTPLIAGATVDDPDLVHDILEHPERYYVNVHTVHNPEGEIRGQIRGFDHGQETDIEPQPANFTVSDLDPTAATVTQGDLIDVSATVRNEGDRTATQTIEARVDGSVVAEETLELRCRESTRVTFENIDTADLDPGEYEHGVFSDDDSATGTLTVQAPPTAAEFTVSDLDPVDVTVQQGDLIDVSATIENVGEETGTQDIDFRLDGDTLASQALELDGGVSETITFQDIDTADLEPGEYEHGVFSEDDSATGTLTVEDPPTVAEFTVSDLDPVDVTVQQGDLIDVSATIENIGEETGTQDIDFRIDGDTLASQALELDGGASETITFQDIDTADLEPGEYEHGVFSEDDSATGTLTVEEPSAVAEFTVSDLDPAAVTVQQGDIIDVSATIENVGEESGTQDIDFRVDGDTLASQALELDGGASETVTFQDIDTADLEPGEYEHGVFSEDDSATAILTVEDAQEENGEEETDEGNNDDVENGEEDNDEAENGEENNGEAENGDQPENGEQAENGSGNTD